VQGVASAISNSFWLKTRFKSRACESLVRTSDPQLPIRNDDE